MSSPTKQLNLPPMRVKQMGSALPSPAKVLGSTPMVDLWVRAFVRCGHNAQQSAGLLELSPSDFSKAFSVNWPERNPLMKRCDHLPIQIRREFAALLSADHDLTLQDSEQTRVLSDFAKLLKAVNG